MQRPLATGRLKVETATAIGTGCILAGLAALGSIGEAIPPLLGSLGLVWYLAVYTPLKRRSAFALPVGALCGALPPLVGYSFAGGDPTDFRILLLAGVLYLWQIPHFWLIQRRHLEDYKKAGIPLLPAVSNRNDLSGIFRLWMAALVTMALLLPAFGIIRDNTAFLYSLFLLPLVLLPFIRSERIIFSYINFFPLLVTVALCF
jgi:protoheme IX farnesyltransferase